MSERLTDLAIRNFKMVYYDIVVDSERMVTLFSDLVICNFR